MDTRQCILKQFAPQELTGWTFGKWNIDSVNASRKPETKVLDAAVRVCLRSFIFHHFMSLLYGLMNLLATLWREFHVCQRVNRSDSRMADAVSGAAFDMLVYSAERLFASAATSRNRDKNCLLSVIFPSHRLNIHSITTVELEPHVWEH